MDAFGQALHLDAAVLDQLMSSPAVASQPERRTPPASLKTAVQKVLNVALHFPLAAARLAGTADLSALNQPGADVLRRVFAAARGIEGVTTAVLLENLRSDPDFYFLERIAAKPPIAIDGDDAAHSELKAALEKLAHDARRSAAVQKIRAHRPGGGPGETNG